MVSRQTQFWRIPLPKARGFEYHYGPPSKRKPTGIVESAHRGENGQGQYRTQYSRGDKVYDSLWDAINAWKAEHAAVRDGPRSSGSAPDQ